MHGYDLLGIQVLFLTSLYGFTAYWRLTAYKARFQIRDTICEFLFQKFLFATLSEMSVQASVCASLMNVTHLVSHMGINRRSHIAVCYKQPEPRGTVYPFCTEGFGNWPRGTRLGVPRGSQGILQIFLDRHLPLLSEKLNNYSDELLMLLQLKTLLTNYFADQR